MHHTLRSHRHLVWIAAAALTAVSIPQASIAQSAPQTHRSLATRPQIDSLADEAERAAESSKDSKLADRKRAEAMRLRARLRNGDFKVGDRFLLQVPGSPELSDTMVVRTGLVVELPNLEAVSVQGLLRSELQSTMEQHIKKYVKQVRVDAVPLTRIAVTGEVGRPGFYSFNSDLLVSDAIMQAGGPTATADLKKTEVRRGGVTVWSAAETRSAIGLGWTIDELGLDAGDEIAIGRRKEVSSTTVMGILAGVTSIVGIVAALGR